eukprot:9636151-Alexandrium_andersonii.AAC.1
MSASLVGSEMCIRDRGGSEASTSEGRGGGKEKETDGAESTERRGRGTVSYTHLTLPTICSV